MIFEDANAQQRRSVSTGRSFTYNIKGERGALEKGEDDRTVVVEERGRRDGNSNLFYTHTDKFI